VLFILTLACVMHIKDSLPGIDYLNKSLQIAGKYKIVYNEAYN